MQISNAWRATRWATPICCAAPWEEEGEEMANQRERFIAGALERGFPQKKIEKIFDLMEQFAGYGFNKSHSAAYAYLAYVTAYLRPIIRWISWPRCSPPKPATRPRW